MAAQSAGCDFLRFIQRNRSRRERENGAGRVRGWRLLTAVDTLGCFGMRVREESPKGCLRAPLQPWGAQPTFSRL
jgi:hypothetical protein